MHNHLPELELGVAPWLGHPEDRWRRQFTLILLAAMDVSSGQIVRAANRLDQVVKELRSEVKVYYKPIPTGVRKIGAL